jgi:hypothetical protein
VIAGSVIAIGWSSDDDAIVLEDCQRLLVSMHRNIESFGEYAAPQTPVKTPTLLAIRRLQRNIGGGWLAALDDFRNWFRLGLEAPAVLDGGLFRPRGDCGRELLSPLPQGQSPDAAGPQSGGQCGVKVRGSIFAVVYRRIVPRLGHAQAIGAITHRLCRLIWKILHERVRYEERGPAVGVEAKKVRARKMIRERRSLGYHVEPLPAPSSNPT